MFFSSSLLALLAVQVFGAAAQDAPADVPELGAKITTTFPDADIFGVKLVNGRPTKALIEVVNNEDGPIQVAFVAGQLRTTKTLSEDAAPYEGILRNLSSVQYNLAVPAGESKAVPFDFALDMQPQDVQLSLTAVVAGSNGNIYSVPAFNDLATIVEPPTSFLDPQIIFLYLVLSGAFVGTLYFVYKTWIEALFPQTKRAKTPKKVKKTVDADAALSGSESTTATATGKDYDQSWIPDHHINRPTAKRVKSGATKKKLGE